METNENTEETNNLQGNSELHFSISEDNSIVSENQYTRGETNVQKTLAELVAAEIQKSVNKVLLYIITTIVGAGTVVVWNLNSKVKELEGKYSSPDKTIETIGNKLENLEKVNQELMQKNFQLEIELVKLETNKKATDK